MSYGRYGKLYKDSKRKKVCTISGSLVESRRIVNLGTLKLSQI